MDKSLQNIWLQNLKPGEVLLWHGSPSGPFKWPIPLKILVVILVLWSAFGFYNMVGELVKGSALWVFGAGYFASGVIFAIAVIWLARLEHTNTSYALSDQRAFIAFDRPLLGRGVRPYPITSKTPLAFDGRDPGNIVFAWCRQHSSNGVSRKIAVVFKGIDDAPRVSALMQHIIDQDAE